MPEWLSANAQLVWKWASLDFWAKENNAITAELQNKWFFDKWMWNIDYYKLSNKEREPISNLYWALSDRFNKIIETKKKLEAKGYKLWWWLESKVKGIWQWIWWPFQNDPDYLELKSLTGESLVEFIKEISGAAVSEEEYQRLASIELNAEMTEETFNSRLKDKLEKHQLLKDRTMRRYWFKDIDTINKQFWVVPATTYTAPTSNNNSQNAYENMMEEDRKNWILSKYSEEKRNKFDSYK